MTIPPSINVLACVKLMKQLNIRRVPISDGNEIIGILSNSDRKELAAEFIKWILSPKGQGLLATSECFWAMPANEMAELSAADKANLRWDDQADFLARSHVSLLPDAEMDAEMLDIWTEFLQS